MRHARKPTAQPHRPAVATAQAQEPKVQTQSSARAKARLQEPKGAGEREQSGQAGSVTSKLNLSTRRASGGCRTRGRIELT